MSVQCKNCINAIEKVYIDYRKGFKRRNIRIICIAWKNNKAVNGKKQRLCERYCKKIL